MEKAKDADAFAFSLDGSATFAIVRNKGDQRLWLPTFFS